VSSAHLDLDTGHRNRHSHNATLTPKWFAISEAVLPRDRQWIKASLGRNRRIACAVRDLSKTVAGLDVGGDVNLPGVFKLLIEMESAQRRCRMIWRKENRMGVVFDS